MLSEEDVPLSVDTSSAAEHSPGGTIGPDARDGEEENLSGRDRKGKGRCTGEGSVGSPRLFSMPVSCDDKPPSPLSNE